MSEDSSPSLGALLETDFLQQGAWSSDLGPRNLLVFGTGGGSDAYSAELVFRAVAAASGDDRPVRAVIVNAFAPLFDERGDDGQIPTWGTETGFCSVSETEKKYTGRVFSAFGKRADDGVFELREQAARSEYSGYEVLFSDQQVHHAFRLKTGRQTFANGHSVEHFGVVVPPIPSESCKKIHGPLHDLSLQCVASMKRLLSESLACEDPAKVAVCAVDTGGDILKDFSRLVLQGSGFGQVDVASDYDGLSDSRDSDSMFLMRTAGLRPVLVVVGPGADGESDPGGLRSAMGQFDHSGDYVRIGSMADLAPLWEEGNVFGDLTGYTHSKKGKTPDNIKLAIQAAGAGNETVRITRQGREVDADLPCAIMASFLKFRLGVDPTSAEAIEEAKQMPVFDQNRSVDAQD